MELKRIEVLKLRCTQLVIGMLEAKGKAKEFRKMSRKEFIQENRKDPVSVVIGPDKNYYIVDGHHRAFASWLAGHKKIHVKVLKNFSHRKIVYDEFWKKMEAEELSHIFDQFGKGPHDPLYLPLDIKALGDDPYRSLVWLVKEKGFIGDTKVKFSEFQWANFFRSKKLLHGHYDRDFQGATGKAIFLAGSKAAKKLPGFIKNIKLPS